MVKFLSGRTEREVRRCQTLSSPGNPFHPSKIGSYRVEYLNLLASEMIIVSDGSCCMNIKRGSEPFGMRLLERNSRAMWQTLIFVLSQFSTSSADHRSSLFIFSSGKVRNMNKRKLKTNAGDSRLLLPFTSHFRPVERIQTNRIITKQAKIRIKEQYATKS